jgi:hypothetical protein
MASRRTKYGQSLAGLNGKIKDQLFRARSRLSSKTHLVGFLEEELSVPVIFITRCNVKHFFNKIRSRVLNVVQVRDTRIISVPVNSLECAFRSTADVGFERIDR